MSTRLESCRATPQDLTRHCKSPRVGQSRKIEDLPGKSEGEIPVQLPAEERLHGGRAVGPQRGLLPPGRQLVKGAAELAVEGGQVDVVLGSVDMGNRLEFKTRVFLQGC